jgi:signal peptidase I
MEPTIHVGSLVLVQKVPENAIKVDDIVARKAPDNDNTFVTHRIVQIGPQPDTFVTRGDANNTNDPPITYSEIVGKMVFAVPMLGLLVNFSSTPIGMGLVIVIFILFIVLVEIIKRLLKA